MKKLAYTFAELFMALIVIMILAAFSVNVFKNTTENKQLKFFAYATITNLTKGAIAVMDNNAEEIKKANITSGADTLDFLCLNMADAFSLKDSPDCKVKVAGSTEKNFTMSNGVVVYGLSTPWIDTTINSTAVSYKNILIDINGTEKPDKIWVDRIPLRIFSGDSYTGLVQPVNCGTSDILGATNPYCKNGSTNINTKFLLDDKVITYDIYKPESDDDDAKAKMIASNLSPLAADCKAYPDKVGLYPKDKCKDSSNADISVLAQCQSEDAGCFTVLHKPGMGASLLLETMIGQEAFE